MDFYCVKFMASSAVTGETYTGYLFGKKKQEPTYNVAVVSRAKIKDYVLPDIKNGYTAFKSDIDIMVYKLYQDDKLLSLNKQFSAFFYTSMKKFNSEIIGTKLYLAVQEGDPYVVKAIIKELLFDWADETEIRIVAEKFDFEDLTWMASAINKGEEGISGYLNRDDVKSFHEVFPVIDPLDGYPVIKLDVGDPIYTLNIQDKGSTEKLTLESKIISKELIPNTEYLLLKVDLGNGAMGKTVVNKNLKVMIDKVKLEQSIKERQIIFKDETPNVIMDFANETMNKKDIYTPRLKSFDLVLVMGFSAIGILLIVLVAIWLGAF